MAKAATKVSPFAPSQLPEMPTVAGVRLAACEAGIRYQNRTDLMMAVFDAGTTVAGVLTLLVVSLGVFVLTQILGDPARAVLGRQATPENIAAAAAPLPAMMWH